MPWSVSTPSSTTPVPAVPLCRWPFATVSIGNLTGSVVQPAMLAPAVKKPSL